MLQATTLISVGLWLWPDAGNGMARHAEIWCWRALSESGGRADVELSVAGSLDGAGDEKVIWTLWADDGWRGGGIDWDLHDGGFWLSASGGC